ncbi:hypothetical protein Fmac_029020 [Flemingia macrophylla]|uniref:Uncharacterized protein n=1 Tax=Flemingia macrophylla TaxID=520843 RepID=A0ABD1L951_9FABA
MDQLSRVKDLPVPEFGSLQAWEARASAAVGATNGDINAGDSKISQLGYNGVPMPYNGDTKEVEDIIDRVGDLWWSIKLKGKGKACMKGEDSTIGQAEGREYVNVLSVC